MPLEEYRRKRHFGKTPEPDAHVPPKPGKKAASTKKLSFVVQKHAASHLHYDLRLEHDGVLLSWAVPKGPSLDPLQKRLAVQVEDHPLAYAGFEGVIPAGEYGGGSVIVWDQGTYEAEGEISKMLAKGHLQVRLDGTKLKGSWHLVRTGGRSSSGKNWLLIKVKDDAVVPLSKGDVLAERPESVLSGRTVEEIAAAPAHVWKGGKAVPTKAAGKKRKSKSQRSSWTTRLRKTTGAAPSKLPTTISPQLATLAERAPEGDDWLHEIKYDGYRLLARLDGGDVTLFTRGGHDWTGRFHGIAAAIASLPCHSAWIDGEAASPGSTGVTNFSEMQAALSSGSTGQLVFFAFDLLFLDGFDLRRTPLVERKELLASLLQQSPSRVQYVDYVSGDGQSFADAACQAGLEGIICKRADAPYRRRSYEDLAQGQVWKIR